ncbi:MAG TPA: hypothetical protein VEU29_08870, partial [Actinomycetota bacterium]|nr:hypothetical protein [Actinomycetota bacterium]
EGRPVVSEYAPEEDEVATTELPQGSAIFEIAAGGGGAWVTSGGDFLFRIAPTIEPSGELGPLGGRGPGRYNGTVAGVAQW